MSLMTKRSFRHWQKSSKRSIFKITKQHIVVVVIVIIIIIIAVAAPQIVQHLKKENSKPPPLLYLLQDLRRHGNQIFKRLPSNRKREKGRSNAHTLKTSKGWLQKCLQPHTRSKETTRVLQSIRESRVSLYRLLF